MSVTFGAPCVGTILGAVSECSKYVTFSIAFGAPVLQTTVGVMFGARRRSVPPRLLETSLATWAAKAGHDFGDTPARQESRRQVRPEVPRTTVQGPTTSTFRRLNLYLPQPVAACI